MTEHDIDRIAAAARAELHREITPAPPDFGRTRKRARTRRAGSFGALAVAAVIAAAITLGMRYNNERSHIVAGPSPSGTNADLLAPGASQTLAPSPLAGRSTMAAVWTGSHMLLWGGDGADGPFDDGAAYDPRADQWALLPDAPLSPRNAPAAVWTGDQMLLWGGSSAGADQRDGAAYNPTTGRWQSLPDAPFASAGRPVGVWTGKEMIVLAGFNSRDAAAYNPATNRWRRLPDLPGQLQAPNPVAVWKDKHVVTVVQPARTSLDFTQRIVTIAPGELEWQNLRDVADGQVVLGTTNEELIAASSTEAVGLREGTWRGIAAAPPGVTVGDTPAVSTGTQVIIWDGASASVVNPSADTWTAIASGDEARRTQAAVVWADGVLLAWGGFPNDTTGVMLRPPSSNQDGRSALEETHRRTAKSSAAATAVG